MKGGMEGARPRLNKLVYGNTRTRVHCIKQRNSRGPSLGPRHKVVPSSYLFLAGILRPRSLLRTGEVRFGPGQPFLGFPE